MAIDFALFGSGNKLQTYGKKTCSVELILDNGLSVYRQKGPNRLIVNGQYEDDAGEAIIKQYFGSNMLTCYIPQNMRRTFILMTPAERLEFLESLISANGDIQEIKTSAKMLIRQLQSEHTEIIGSLATAKSLFEMMVQPAKKQFPVRCAESKQDVYHQNEKIRLKNTLILIKRAEKQLAAYTAELQDTIVLENIVVDRRNQIASFSKQLECLVPPTLFIGTAALADLETRLAKCISLLDRSSGYVEQIYVCAVIYKYNLH